MGKAGPLRRKCSNPFWLRVAVSDSIPEANCDTWLSGSGTSVGESVVNGCIAASAVRLADVLSIPLRFLASQIKSSAEMTKITVVATPIITSLIMGFRWCRLVDVENPVGESFTGILVIK